MQTVLVGLWSCNTADSNTHGSLNLMMRSVLLKVAVSRMRAKLDQESIALGQKIRGIFVAPEYYFSHDHSGSIHLGAVQERSVSEADKNTILADLLKISRSNSGILLVPGTVSWKKPFLRTGESRFVRDKQTGTRTNNLKPISRAAKAQDAINRENTVLGGDLMGGSPLLDSKLRSAIIDDLINRPSFEQMAITEGYRFVWPNGALVYNPAYDNDVRNVVYGNAEKYRNFQTFIAGRPALLNMVCAQHNLPRESYNVIPKHTDKTAKTTSVDFLMRNTAYVCLDGKLRFKYAKRGDFHEAIGANQDTVFVPGSKVGDATIEGIHFGFEICLDHALGYLRKGQPTTPVTVHIVSSAAVENKVDHMPVEPGGYFLHASSRAEWTKVYQNLGDVMVELKGAGMGQLPVSDDVGGDPMRYWKITVNAAGAPELTYDRTYGQGMPQQNPWATVPLLPRNTFIMRLREVFQKYTRVMKLSGMRVWLVGPRDDQPFKLMAQDLALEWTWWQRNHGVRLQFVRNVSTERFTAHAVRFYTY